MGVASKTERMNPCSSWSDLIKILTLVVTV